MSDGIGLGHPTVITAVIGFFGMVATGMFGFFGGRGSVEVSRQNVLNQTLELYTKELRTDLASAKKEILALEGNIAQLFQYNLSLARILRENNIDVPPPPKVETVFIIGPSSGT